MVLNLEFLLNRMTVKTSQLTNYISGEYGFMLAIVSTAFAYEFWRGRDRFPPAS
jgi:hypothetical protein